MTIKEQLLQAEGERDIAIERNLRLEAALQRIEAKFYDAFGQPMVPECDKDPHPGQIARAALAGKPQVCRWRWSDEADVSTQITDCECEFICYPAATICPGCGKPLVVEPSEEER